MIKIILITNSVKTQSRKLLKQLVSFGRTKCEELMSAFTDILCWRHLTERSTEDSQSQKHVTLGKNPLGEVNGNTSSRR